jgi:cell division protease FtsH
MARSPFPQGTTLVDGTALGRAVTACSDSFWIHSTKDGRRALLMTEAFQMGYEQNQDSKDIISTTSFIFGNETYRVLIADGALDVLDRLRRPQSTNEAMAFARALADSPAKLGNAIYSEQLSRLVIFDDDEYPARDKAEILGKFLTGGVQVSAADVVALHRILPKTGFDDLQKIVAAAGIQIKSPVRGADKPVVRLSSPALGESSSKTLVPFVLPGRLALSDFFNEHVIEVVADEVRYAALGIGFPGGIILEGPTGCGKTFAVERLVEHLGWASFSIEASSVASPYIHETSRKVAEVFAAAIKEAPSVIIIDEMDAFLASRDGGVQQHHVEEVAEFLRRIPEASNKRVLVIGMTNKVDAIDPAILRRGRFDHVINVGPAGRVEIEGLLKSMLVRIPNEISDVGALAGQLEGRPLSDVSFVVREAGRLAARARKDLIGDKEISAAFAMCPSRDADDQRRIGF